MSMRVCDTRAGGALGRRCPMSDICGLHLDRVSLPMTSSPIMQMTACCIRPGGSSDLVRVWPSCESGSWRDAASTRRRTPARMPRLSVRRCCAASVSSTSPDRSACTRTIVRTRRCVATTVSASLRFSRRRCRATGASAPLWRDRCRSHRSCTDVGSPSHRTLVGRCRQTSHACKGRGCCGDTSGMREAQHGHVRWVWIVSSEASDPADRSTQDPAPNPRLPWVHFVAS